MFGKMFFVFCQESGYDTILRVLGSNVREFLQVRILCQIVSDTRQSWLSPQKFNLKFQREIWSIHMQQIWGGGLGGEGGEVVVLNGKFTLFIVTENVIFRFYDISSIISD